MKVNGLVRQKDWKQSTTQSKKAEKGLGSKKESPVKLLTFQGWRWTSFLRSRSAMGKELPWEGNKQPFKNLTKYNVQSPKHLYNVQSPKHWLNWISQTLIFFMTFQTQSTYMYLFKQLSVADLCLGLKVIPRLHLVYVCCGSMTKQNKKLQLNTGTETQRQIHASTCAHMQVCDPSSPLLPHPPDTHANTHTQTQTHTNYQPPPPPSPTHAHTHTHTHMHTHTKRHTNFGTDDYH